MSWVPWVRSSALASRVGARFEPAQVGRTVCGTRRAEGSLHGGARTEVVGGVAHTLLVDHRDRRLPRRAGDPIAVWIDDAIRRRQKILYELEPTETREEVLAALVPEGAEHQVEVLAPAVVQAESSGTADGLALLHRSRVDQAHDRGWSGLAVVTGPTVFTEV